MRALARYGMGNIFVAGCGETGKAMERSGLVWHGKLLAVVRCGGASQGVVRSGLVRRGSVGTGRVRRGRLRHGMAWNKILVRPSMVGRAVAR